MPYWAREEPLIRKGRPDKKFAELMVGPGLGRLFLDRHYCSVQQITGHVVGQPILAAAAFQAALSLLTPVHPFHGRYASPPARPTSSPAARTRSSRHYCCPASPRCISS